MLQGQKASTAIGRGATAGAVAGLTAAGVDMQLLGPMPTPGVAYLTRTLRARTGIVISASHNPYYDNGIKFFSAQGTKLPDEVELALGARYTGLDELMAQSDYIIVQLPLNESTQGIIGRKQLAAVKPGSILINTARAHLVDRDALLEALDSGRLAAVAMDVGYAEPWSPDDPLLKYRDGRVIAMPHTAVGDRRVGLSDLAEMCRNIWRIIDNRRTGRRK